MLHLWTNIFRSLSGELNRGLKASFNLHKVFAGGGSFYGVNSTDSFNSSSTSLLSLNFLKLKKAICANQNTLVDMRLQASFIGCLANRFFVGLDQRKLSQGKQTRASQCRSMQVSAGN